MLETGARLKETLYALPGAAPDAATSTSSALLYKVGGKMFAILGAGKLAHVIVKADPHLIEVLNETYQGVGHRGHLDRRFWINIMLDEDVPFAETEKLVRASYDLIVSGLTKKQRAELG